MDVVTSKGIDWQREKWQSGLGSKFIHQGEKNAAKYVDEVIVLSKGVQDYFKETYGRETHFIPNGVNRPQIREASLITDKFGLKKDSYILFLGRLVPEKGIRYLVEAFKNVKTDKKLVIAGSSSDTDSFMPIHLINSGATALDGSGACVDAKGNHVMKPFWEMTDADIKACLNATDWCRADYEYFRGGGYSSHFRCKAEMPVTMLRFNIVEGIGPVLQIAEGWTADLPDEIHNTIDKRTDPTWPTTWFCPRLTGQGAFTDVYSVMANWGANHGVTVYGHVGADLITLASMLRIPVTMHNVPAEKVYRPHAWASFGTQDQQAADYAACKQYGPLYR